MSNTDLKPVAFLVYFYSIFLYVMLFKGAFLSKPDDQIGLLVYVLNFFLFFFLMGNWS